MYIVINCSISHLFQITFNVDIYTDIMSHQITPNDMYSFIYVCVNIYMEKKKDVNNKTREKA
jgi:hypothetical protein